MIGRMSVATALCMLFALDAMLTVPPGADREAVPTAMQGHVLARGEYVGTFHKTP